MAYKIVSQKHAYCFPTKIAASSGCPHIYNIHLTTAADNGNIIGKGAFEALDLYTEADAPEFAGLILGTSPKGNWYVEVTAATDALLVYNSPILPFEKPYDLADLKNYFNAAGDIVKAYSLIKGDVFEVSAEAFDGTPVAGKTVSVKAKKLLVAA